MNIVCLDAVSLGTDLALSPLRTYGNVTVYDASTQEDALERVRDADVLILNKFKATKPVFDAAKNLKLICEFATGYDNIDLNEARAHGVAVCNVPAYSTDSVALWTIATALSLVTHLETYHRFVADGSYSVSGAANRLEPVYHELAGRTWGVLGCGNIGKRVAGVAEAFGMKIIVNKRTPGGPYTNVDVDTLCRESDILSIHCPLNDATRGIIDARRLSLMKPTAILVNEARGAVTDEKAVAEAVKTGTIAAFGADVYSTEPFGKDHPFYEIKDRENVLLTPHAAWGAYDARKRCLDIILSNIDSFLHGGTQNRVD